MKPQRKRPWPDGSPETGRRPRWSDRQLCKQHPPLKEPSQNHPKSGSAAGFSVSLPLLDDPLSHGGWLLDQKGSYHVSTRPTWSGGYLGYRPTSDVISRVSRVKSGFGSLGSVPSCDDWLCLLREEQLKPSEKMKLEARNTVACDFKILSHARHTALCFCYCAFFLENRSLVGGS